jgi:hypothetical protein
MGETSKPKSLRLLPVLSNSFPIARRPGEGEPMRMLGSRPRVDRIAFDQPGGNDDQRTTPTTFAASARKPLLGQIGHKIAVLTRLEQTHNGLVARLMSRCSIGYVLVFFLGTCRSEADCVDPATTAHATVAVTRYFDEEERNAEPDLVGIRGTGWFLSARSMVTVAHVAEAMHLSAQDWKSIEIRDGENKQSISVRLLRLVGADSEKIAVLELRTPFLGAQFLPVRTEPLVTNERVISVAYPDGRLRVADGRFVEYKADDKFSGAALFELYDGNDRLVLDHGASGAPILDCQGRVVAVVSNLLTRTIQFLSRVIRISTAWDNPNVISVPVQMLKDFAPAE